jgi:hypothetical protein
MIIGSEGGRISVLEAVFFVMLPESRDGGNGASDPPAAIAGKTVKPWPRGIANPILAADIRVGGDVP